MCLIAAGVVCAVHWANQTRVELMDALSGATPGQPENTTDRKLAQAMTTNTTTIVIGRP